MNYSLSNAIRTAIAFGLILISGELKSQDGLQFDSPILLDTESLDLNSYLILEQTDHHGRNEVFAIGNDSTLKWIRLDDGDEWQTKQTYPLPDGFEPISISGADSISFWIIGKTPDSEIVLWNPNHDSLAHPEQNAESLIMGSGFYSEGSTHLFHLIESSSSEIILRHDQYGSEIQSQSDTIVLSRSCSSSEFGVLRSTGHHHLIEVGCNQTYIHNMTTAEENVFVDYFYNANSILDLRNGFRDANQNGQPESVILTQRDNSYVVAWFFEQDPINGLITPDLHVQRFSWWSTPDSPNANPNQSAYFANSDGELLTAAILPESGSIKFNRAYDISPTSYPFPLTGLANGFTLPYPAYNNPQRLLILDFNGNSACIPLTPTQRLSELFQGGNGHNYCTNDGPSPLKCLSDNLLLSLDHGDTLLAENIYSPFLHWFPDDSVYHAYTRDGIFYTIDPQGSFIDTASFPVLSQSQLWGMYDADDDGDLDVHFIENDTLRVFKNINSEYGTSITTNIYTTPSCQSDYNEDGLIDWAWAQDDSIYIALNLGNFFYQITPMQKPDGILVNTAKDSRHGPNILMTTGTTTYVYTYQNNTLILADSILHWNDIPVSHSQLNNQGDLVLALGLPNRDRLITNNQEYQPYKYYAYISDSTIHTTYSYGWVSGTPIQSPQCIADAYPFGPGNACNHNNYIGCTDTSACNFSPTALISSGCNYACKIGCMDPQACNYSSDYSIPNQSCEFDCYGCTNPEASNFNEQASIEDGTCFITNEFCPDQVNQSICLSSNQDTIISSCFAQLEYDQNVILQISGELELLADSIWVHHNNETIFASSSEFDLDTTITVSPADCIEIRFITDASLDCGAGNFEPITIFMDCAPVPYKGCMEANACNYSPQFTIDGPCVYPDECGNCQLFNHLDNDQYRVLQDYAMTKFTNPDTLQYEGIFYPNSTDRISKGLPIGNTFLWPSNENNRAEFVNAITGEPDYTVEFIDIGSSNFIDSKSSYSSLFEDAVQPDWLDENGNIHHENVRYGIGGHEFLIRSISSGQVWHITVEYTTYNNYKWAAYPIYDLQQTTSEITNLDQQTIDGTIFRYVNGNATAPADGYQTEYYYSKSDYAPFIEALWDNWGSNFAVYRNDNQGLYNPYYCDPYCLDGGYELGGSLWGAPGASFPSEYSEWWYDIICNHPDLGCNNSNDIVGKRFWVYVESLDATWEVEFTDWTCCNSGGGFSYTRTRLGSGPPVTGSELAWGTSPQELDAHKNFYDCTPPQSTWLAIDPANDLYITRGCNGGWYNPLTSSDYDGGSIPNLLWGPANSTNLNEYSGSWSDMMCDVFNDCSYACYLDVHGVYVETTQTFYNLHYDFWQCGCCGGEYSVRMTPMGFTSPQSNDARDEFLEAEFDTTTIEVDTVLFSFTGGVELFDIPTSASFLTITAKGANGAERNGQPGGMGAHVTGTFHGLEGQLRILIGDNGEAHSDGCGGGATSIFHGENPLIIAGGGAGSSGNIFQSPRQNACLHEYSRKPYATNGDFGRWHRIWSLDGEQSYSYFGYPGGGVESIKSQIDSLLSNSSIGSDKTIGGGGLNNGWRPGGGGGFSGGSCGNSYEPYGGACASGGGSYNNGWFQRFDLSDGDPYLEILIFTIDTLRCGNGCLDPIACNYDGSSLEDDGSCEYLTCSGCKDEGACNYSTTATIPDPQQCDFVTCAGCLDEGACNYDPEKIIDAPEQCDYLSCAGCLDPVACNYDEEAILDAFDCVYASPHRDCEGDCYLDFDGDGVCDEEEVPGCTYPGADNFDPSATDENGTCQFAGVDDLYGCTYPTACNYNPDATADDASCVYPELGYDCDGNCLFDTDGDGICNEYEGCTNELACNYDPQAIDNDGSCTFALSGYDCDGNCLQDADGDGICDPFEFPGCTDPAACNYYEAATDDDGSCSYAATGYDCFGFCLGDMDSDGVCDANEIEGCAIENACNFDPTATDNDGSCVFAEPYQDCDGNCLNDFDADGICDEEEILGCTYLDAVNYNPAATEDDNTCVFEEEDPVPGCFYSTACNYQPDATVNDGSCIFPTLGYDCDGNCIVDTDGDGVCDLYEVSGCTDEGACNFDPAATDNDFNCDYVTCAGCMELAACDYDPTATLAAPCDYLSCAGCMDEAACNYDETATLPSFCNYPDPGTDCNGDCLIDTDGDGECDALPGCTDPDALNYDPAATLEDGTCIYPCSACVPVFEVVPVDSTVTCPEELPMAPLAYTAYNPCTDEPIMVLSFTLGTDETVCGESITFRYLALNSSCANFTEYIQTISVEDNVSPEITSVPEDWTLSCSDAFNPGDVTVADDCRPLNFSYSLDTLPGSCPDIPALLRLERTVTVDDGCGNEASQSYLIDIIDTVAPVMTDLPPSTVQISCSEEIPTHNVTVATDCGAEAWVTDTLYIVSEIDCPVIANGYRTYTAMDACGNSSTYDVHYPIVDLNAPSVLFVPEDITIECGDVVPEDMLILGDDCLGSFTSFSDNLVAGDCPTEYTIERTHTASDECQNTVDFLQVIQVVDTVAPSFAEMELFLITTCAEQQTEYADAADLCGEANISFTTSLATDPGLPGQEIRLYTADDGCGNVSQALQVVSYSDLEACGGCMDPIAENYDEFASVEDGSCTYDLANPCPTDLSGDGQIGIEDLLEVLGNFGTFCE